MAKESRQRKNDRKKPTMTLKEKRAKKHEKQRSKLEHHADIMQEHSDAEF